MNNKGISYIFIMFAMSIVLIFTFAISTMGLNEYKLSIEANDRSKAYYMAEAGMYYAKGVINYNKNKPSQVPSTITVPAATSDIGPFYDSTTPSNGYIKQHGFVLTFTYDSIALTFTVKSKGQYNGREAMVQAVIPINGSTIYNLHEITDINLQ